jgi:hypothetical protein
MALSPFLFVMRLRDYRGRFFVDECVTRHICPGLSEASTFIKGDHTDGLKTLAHLSVRCISTVSAQSSPPTWVRLRPTRRKPSRA